jgi:excisionase family DNA binding protein
MSKIPQSVLSAGCGMFAPYVSNLSPERLEQVLMESSKPAELAPGYTPAEFCKLAKISKQTLWNWERSGRINLSRVGRIVRIPRPEAERILAGEN